MTVLKLAGDPGALDTAASIAEFKEQIAAANDMLRQLGGNAVIAAGDLAQADPLSSPFTLYVNPYIGSDKFVGGSYNDFEDGATDEEIIASKLKRIELQRVHCGYTPFRPFRTINRAAIEAAIITSKNWYAYSDPRAHVDCVSIVLAPGVHVAYNDPGSSSTDLDSWGDEYDPSVEDLIKFNPTTGGILLPRGCSMPGSDLRKTTVRPNWVPSVADEESDYSNRRAIFKVTGTGYFFGATTMDKIGHAESCHLLDTFHPASKDELDAFYEKVEEAVGTGADLASALIQTRSTEHEIVGPIDTSQNPTSAWDTTASASPYIFNWSIRSDYGIGGAFWDGDKIEGLKSMVCANFTGVSKQKDMRCWQVYEEGEWLSLTNTPEDYETYINASPDSVRMNPVRSTRHISAVNDAFIQEVSVFGIGQAGMNYTDEGGEITITNSNSTFGGCAAISRGYKRAAFPKDKNWAVSRIRVPRNLSEKANNIRRIYLGTIQSVTSSAITLTNSLSVSPDSATVPALLLQDGYSLASGTRIWVENPIGANWRTSLTSSAWSSSTPAQINISGELLQSGTDDPAGTTSPVGRRVYIRRLVDTRLPNERRTSLLLSNTASVRLPQRNFILQTDPNRSGGAIERELAKAGSELLLAGAVGTGLAIGGGVVKTAELTIRRGAAERLYAASTYYRAGTVVRYAGKHWQAKATMVSSGSSPDPALWGETYVHMPSDFNPEDSVTQEAPQLILDTDISDDETSTTLGINWSTVWTSAGIIRDQYRSGTDYLGVHAFLVALGLTSAQAHSALVPKVAASRDLDPASATDFPNAPTGGAATGRGNWAVEFRRPSVLRLYGHSWEWAGFGNYSKALPAVQQDMSAFNKFTYYFTNANGGRVVPQGSNEDGFNITPRGLEDVETGATTSLEDLDGVSIEEGQVTAFPNGISAGGTSTFETVVIGQGIEFPPQSTATTELLGPVQLASTEEIDEQTAAAENDGQINNSGDKVVSLPALERWKAQRRLVALDTDGKFVLPTNTPISELTVTGPVSGGRFIPTGQTVPSLGMYLFVPGVIGFSANGTGQLYVSSSGIEAPVGFRSQASGFNAATNIPITPLGEGYVFTNFPGNGANASLLRFSSTNTAPNSSNSWMGAVYNLNYSSDLYFWSGKKGNNSLVSYDSALNAIFSQDQITFYTGSIGTANTSEKLRITSTGQLRLATAGITFNGDTVTANELDDYEEGTWTPVISGTGTAGAGTYSVQVGRYTKIGNTVTAHLHLVWSSHTGTTNMRISGLPFTSANVTNLTPVAAVTATNLTITGAPVVVVNTNATTADISSLNNGTQAALAMDTAATLRATITYQTT